MASRVVSKIPILGIYLNTDTLRSAVNDRNIFLHLTSSYIFRGLSWADVGGPAKGWTGPVNVTIGRDPTRPGLLKFQRIGTGPAQPIPFQQFHGPAWSISFAKLSARLSPAHHMTARPVRHGPCGPAQQQHEPGRGFDGLAHELSCTERCMSIH